MPVELGHEISAPSSRQHEQEEAGTVISRNSMRHVAVLGATALGLAAGVAFAAPAGAVSEVFVTASNGIVHVNGTVGRDVLLQSWAKSGNVEAVGILSPGGSIRAGLGCTQDGFSGVECADSKIIYLEVTLGGGNDEWRGAGPVPATIDGGDGKDLIYGSASNDKVNGGNGTDNLVGGGGLDLVNGGSGLDACNPWPAPTTTECELGYSPA